LIEAYPNSDQVAQAIAAIMNVKKRQIANKKLTTEDLIKYFDGMRDKYQANAILRNKLGFAIANYVSTVDPSRALSIMQSNFNEKLKYSPKDLETYLTFLLKNKKIDDAKKVMDKLDQDFPIPKDTPDPARWRPEVKDAQGAILYGKASVEFAKGNMSMADSFLTTFRKTYPTSSKMADIIQMQLEIASKAGNKDLVFKLASELAVDRNAPPSLKAKALFITAELLEKEGKTRDAADCFLKIPAFYGGVTEIAPEALYRGAGLLEKIAEGEQKPEDKIARYARARKAYDAIIEKFGSSPFASKAQERKAALSKYK